LCLILVVFLLVLFSAERSPTAEIARGSISVNNGLVSMKLKDVRIKDVLKELAEQH
jgi:hypothetical protein